MGLDIDIIDIIDIINPPKIKCTGLVLDVFMWAHVGLLNLGCIQLIEDLLDS